MRYAVLAPAVVALALAGCSSSSKSSNAASTIGATVKLDSGADQVIAGNTRTDFDKVATAVDAQQSVMPLLRTGQALTVGKCTTAKIVDAAFAGERQVEIVDDPQFADNNGKTVWVDANWIKDTCTTPGLSARGGAVSPTCDAAMKAVVNLDPNAPDSVVGPIQDATLSACTTKAEWLAGAQKYRSSGIDRCVICGNATADSVWTAFCDGNSDKPACKG